MNDNSADINSLVLSLAAIGMRPLLNDEIWQCYDYKKRPRHGSIWHTMFPKMFELEHYISKEVLVMGLIDVLNGVKKSTEPFETKLLISIGVVDQFLSTTKHLFSPEVFMQNLFDTYTLYLKTEKSKLHELIVLKAKDILNKKDFARFMVGTIKLFVNEEANDFLLKSDYIKDLVEKSPKGNKLNISMSDEMYKKYVPLIEQKILLYG